MIGNDDRGVVLGLDDDFSIMKKGNIDGFELEVRQSIQKYTKSKNPGEHIQFQFSWADGKQVCAITVKRGRKPTIIYNEGAQECYVRQGNSSKPYAVIEFVEYSCHHFYDKIQ